MIDYLSIISRHTAGEDPRTVPAFIVHSALVTKKALDIANQYLSENPGANLDLRLLEEMGMLHDIGIFRTRTPQLFTTGEGPYRAHTIYGHDILKEEGLDEHARAAKNHTAIRAREIREQELPIPEDDHLPETLEEEILFVADQFFSKDFKTLFSERSLEEVRDGISKNPEKLELFDELWAKFCG